MQDLNCKERLVKVIVSLLRLGSDVAMAGESGVQLSRDKDQSN